MGRPRFVWIVVNLDGVSVATGWEPSQAAASRQAQLASRASSFAGHAEASGAFIHGPRGTTVVEACAT
ncbi:hypothetical protein [uncultured Brevundimonas sp.]|uniref:hypothetical protein n=1 Tax=uncultured Brevundimonas sp. TaxID=213418 RepID=UPI00261E6839|nr:hypothetical protein [uncultured Brevundimonas sp.]